jgi:hypothetical protein
VVKTTLNAEARAHLSKGFWPYVAQIPYATLVNTIDFVTMFYKSQRFFGGPGLSFEMTCLNFTEEESTRLAQGLKKKGIKPYALFIYASQNAYKKVVGHKPYCVVQQASLQTRCYEPPLPERRFLGDWLIGPCHYFKKDQFTLQDAQQVYEDLLSNLDQMSEEARSAAIAKAFCPIGGAAVFQFFPFYAHPMAVMDSVFLNNYGRREIHPEAELHCFNWGAPFRLGFNTLNVNGKTCLCLASSHLGLPALRAARDHVEGIFREIMA